MFFYLDFIDVSCITSNGAADVLHISREQRRRRRTICFVKIVNATGDLQYVFIRGENRIRTKGITASSSADDETDFCFVKITADVRQK